MPTPDQLNSLQALLSGRANVANSRQALRNVQTADPRATNSFKRMVGLEDADEAQMFADDPQSQGYEDIAQGQAAATTDQVPAIAQMRERDLADKERLLTAPARTQGQYAVEAAKAAGKARGEASAAQYQAMDERAKAAQEAALVRAQTTQAGQNQRQQATLDAKKPKGMLSGLMGMLGMGGQTAPAAAPASTGGAVAMLDPSGEPLTVPADRVNEALALGATLAN